MGRTGRPPATRSVSLTAARRRRDEAIGCPIAQATIIAGIIITGIAEGPVARFATARGVLTDLLSADIEGLLLVRPRARKVLLRLSLCEVGEAGAET